jgi:ribonuclease D
VNYVIDALAGLSMDALGGLFYDPRSLKIFHSAGSDIQELQRDNRWEFRNIFDTFLGCKMLGYDGCSLASLVKNLEGVVLEKREQKSNWKRRPLSSSQLRYASLDTVFLESLMNKMREEIIRFGFLEEIEQEFQFIAENAGIENEKDPNEPLLKMMDQLQNLNPERRGRLRALIEFREKRARALNIAPFRLISKDAMVELARGRAVCAEDIERVHGISPIFLKSDRQRLIEVLADAGKMDDEEFEALREQNPEEEEIFKRLKQWRQSVADYRGMESSVILSNRVLRKILHARPTGVDDIRQMHLMTEWKVRHYGADLLRVLYGESISFHSQSLTRLPDERRVLYAI